jgi:formylmethanofuran dehydrogenase subunit E
VGIDEPKGCKKLIVYVETDRCATDAVQAVTGCSLGKRSLKFLDYGKMAVTFLNLDTSRAVRLTARDDARQLAAVYCPDAATPAEAQKNAYRVMPEQALFSVEPAKVHLSEQDFPGHRDGRVPCANCGEGVNLRRAVRLSGRTVCIPCAHGSREAVPYLAAGPNTTPVLLIVGYKKVGKTTVLEKLVAELSGRGYRVACAKRHHAGSPVTVDSPGTDTWRFRRAGAQSVALVAPAQVALFHERTKTRSLDDIIATLGPTDIVLAEGFHLEPRPKIEVVAANDRERLCATDENLVAVIGASDESAVPSFSREEIVLLADFVERRILHKLPDASQPVRT